MADVTTTFAAKDESFAQTVDRLNARLAGFQQTVADFSGKVGNMASAFGGFATKIGGVAAAFFGAQSAAQTFSQAINVGGQLAELSARTGESAGNLAVLQRAFQNAGSSGEAVGPMLNRLQKFMVEASMGGKQQIETMTGLGLTYDQLAAKTPTEQMALFASKISGIDDPAERAAAAIAIFGKSGGELLPLLQNMGAEISTAREQLGSYPDAVDAAAASLDGIGDAFAAVTKKAQEFVTGALVKIAPEIEGVLNAVAKIDFAAFGMRLSEHLEKAVDFFRGLWSNPSQIFGLLGDYLNATFRQAGDSLASAFLTAGNALMNFFNELVNSGAFTQLGQVLADALVYGASQLGVLLIDGIQEAMNFFGTLWASVTGQGVGDFAAKLLDVAKFFASDFVQAMTNPVAFIAGKLGSSLADAVTQGADTYKFAFDDATGTYIEKARAGLQGVADTAGTRLEKSSAAFGETIVSAATSAAEQSDLIEVNLFGGAKAIEQVNQRIAEIVTAGNEYKGTMRSAVTPATEIKQEAQATAREGRSFAGAINQAKIDANITSDLFKGLSDRMQTAVNRTSQMLDKMREAFYFGQKTHREFFEDARKAGKTITEASIQATKKMAEQQKQNMAMERLELKASLAERARDRKLSRADDYEKRGYWRSADKLRRRAEAEYTKKMEKLRPELDKATEAARKNLESGSKGIKDGGENIGQGGDKAAGAMEVGGTKAGEQITEAASGLKEVVDNMNKQLALDKTLQQCRELLKSIDEKLPQNSLS